MVIGKQQIFTSKNEKPGAWQATFHIKNQKGAIEIRSLRTSTALPQVKHVPLQFSLTLWQTTIIDTSGDSVSSSKNRQPRVEVWDALISHHRDQLHPLGKSYIFFWANALRGLGDGSLGIMDYLVQARIGTKNFPSLMKLFLSGN